MEQNEEKQIKAYDRYLSKLDVWALAFGCMVGWGIFAMPGSTFLPVAGPAGTLISFAIGTVIMLIIARNFSYLMGRSSMTGGIYTYTKEAFGRDHAFLCSWFLCLSYLTIVFLNGTALFLVARTLFGTSIHKGIYYTVAGNKIYFFETLVSILVLAVVGILFMAFKPLLQKMHTILSVILLAGVVITAVFCLPHAVSSGSLSSFGTGSAGRGFSILSLVILAPWAFVGFETTSFDTAHFKFPIQKSGKIIVISIITAAFAYVSMALISTASVPDGFGSWQEYIMALDSLSGIDAIPTFYVAKSIMGQAGLIIMVITAVAAILTGLIGGYRATTRVLSTMAEDRILSKVFSRTTVSILFVMIISIIISILGRNTLEWFVDLTSFGAIVGFGYTSAAAYKIAKMENNRAVTITGVVGSVISVVFIVVQLVPSITAMEAMSSEAFLLLSVWCLVGFVFYWQTVNRSTLTEYSGMSASGVALFALLLYSAMMWLAKSIYRGESVEDMRNTLIIGGIILLVIIFVGLTVMIYVQNVVRKKHEESEREKIHAVESSLAKSQFLFNMSHDIRTPMNAIIGYTHLALKEPASKEMHGYLEKIDTSGQHLLALINDILEMSRIESGKIELDLAPADLCAVFDGIRDLFAEQMKQKDIDFSVHTGQVRNRYVWCDRKNLNRILLNVISNAFKFTPAGGSVSASLWEISTGDSDYASFEMRVKDNGIGMSREFADRMFNAFERERSSTDSGVEGTGLGLSITKRLVDLMGGTIEVITAPGSGTEMIMHMKFKKADESELPENERNRDEQQVSAEDHLTDFAGKRLLVVDDNEINMEIANMILTQAGFEVENAENGQMAVDMVKASVPGHYDGILMDIQMPVMNGYEATRAIRALENKELASIPIMAMTANAFKEDEEAAAEAGMQAHIAKPIDVSVLMQTLSSVLGAAQREKNS